MPLFYFLVIVLVVLLSITIISSIIKVALLLTTRYKYDTKTLIVPSLLTISTWFAVSFGVWFTIKNVLKIDFLNLLFSVAITKEENIQALIPIIITLALAIFIGIILQALSYFTVNINYTYIFGTIRCNIKKSLKQKNVQIVTTQDEKIALAISNKEKNLNISTSFVASFFAFTLIFFCALTLFLLGNLLGVKINI